MPGLIDSNIYKGEIWEIRMIEFKAVNEDREMLNSMNDKHSSHSCLHHS